MYMTAAGYMYICNTGYRKTYNIVWTVPDISVSSRSRVIRFFVDDVIF